MRTKDDIKAWAAALGSSAATFRGAARYIRQHGLAPSDTPLECCGHKERRTQSRRDYYLTRRGARICRALGLWERDAAEELAVQTEAAIVRRLTDVLYEQWPYRRANGRWAGGAHHIRLTVDDRRYDVATKSQRVWSKNGKWSGRDSYAEITITRRTVMRLGTDIVQDGKIIVDIERPGEKGFSPCVWLEQSSGFALRMQAGYYIGGRLIAARSVQFAQRKFAAMVARRMEA